MTKAVTYDLCRIFDPETPALRHFCHRRRYCVIADFIDVGERRQCQLRKAIQFIRSGKASAVVVHSPSRLAPNVREFCRIAQAVVDAGGTLIFANSGGRLGKRNTSAFKALHQILQLEQDLRSLKIRRGLLITRLLGKVVGRRKISPEIQRRVLDLKDSGLSIREICRQMSGQISRTSISLLLQESKPGGVIT